MDEYYECDPDRGILKGWIRDSTTHALEKLANMDQWQSPLTKASMHLDGKDLIVPRPDGRIFLDSEESGIEIRSIRKAREQALAEISVLAEKLKGLGIDPDRL